MNKNTNIVYIDADKLMPHPKNPRLDIGDVSELADSIKENGVLQNLTVVPWRGIGEGRYTVVIGHRRLAAAKLAGVKRLPCTVVEMDQKEQLETMLLENMQRKNLNIFEEVQGVQMVMDLGESVETIHKKTGVSRTKIYNLSKLGSLDKEKFKASMDKPATIDDYLKLSKIEDESLRNKVFDHIGTNEFDYQLAYARQKEQKEKNRVKIVGQLKEFAAAFDERDDGSAGLELIDTIDLKSPVFTKPDDAGEDKYYYAEADNQIYLYREDPNADEETPSIIEAEEPDTAEQQKRCDALDEVFNTAYALRAEFVKTVPLLSIHKDVILRLASYALIVGHFVFGVADSVSKVLELTGADFSDMGENQKGEAYIEYSNNHPERAALLIAWASIDDGSVPLHDVSGKYIESGESKILRGIYGFLTELGYKMSAEEESYINGTHECFVREAKDEENK